eukprot:m.163899 g.163899  ORF g.163899 m.163899 type:complete len:1320 (+) comp12355_c0_seq1:134-4093(+)
MKGVEVDPNAGENPLNFGCASLALARLMETGKVEEGDASLGPDDKTAIRALRAMGGAEGLASKLSTDIVKGIDSKTIEERRRVYGPNEIEHEKPKSYLQLCWDAAQDSTLIMLQIAATVSLVLETSTADEDHIDTAWIEGVAIFVTVFIVINVTAFNDYKKEQQFRALKAKADEGKVVAVFRDGHVVSHDYKPEELVVGDIVDVKAGDVLAADGVLVSGHGIAADEAAMTGESRPRAKDPVDVPWMFAGTSVQTGQGRMLVTAVGINSAEGIINSLVTGAGADEKARQKIIAAAMKLPDIFDDSKAETNSLAENDVDRVNKKEGQKDSVLSLKLEKLAWSIGAVATIMAILCLFGLIIRLLVVVYSDCDGCDNSDRWSTDEWGQLVSFFVISVTVLVVAIPEGLPLAVTISLAYSVRKMQKDMCLVRVLASCETMGNAQCICSDKTGTLTQNKMSVQAVFIDNKVFGDSEDADIRNDGPLAASKDLPPELLLAITENGALNSNWKSLYVPKLEASTGSSDDPKNMPMDRRIEMSRDFIAKNVNEVEQVGSKTDCAILLLADYYHEQTNLTYVTARDKYGVSPMQYDFDHKKKRMTTVVKRPADSTIFKPGSHRAYVKGAPQYLLPLCTTIATSDGPKPLTDEMKAKIEEDVINSFATQAFRVLLLAYKDIPESDFTDEDGIVSELTLHCITGIMDPPRDEVIQAIKDCHSAGVTVRMVTGDAKETATAIAIKIGLCTKEEALEEGTVWVGKDFSARVFDEATETIDFVECAKIWPKLKVMGRCEPRDKYNLVSALIHDGEVVAVTGDGTNDAPALAKADVGFAMGLTGTDVAKSASDIVLLDDNFASIVKAISWGRNVYDSISKFLVFQLTVNVVAVLVAFFGSISIGTTPLRATQLLWVNLIMDTFASLALATEVPTPALLERLPYKRDDPLLTKHMAKKILGHAVYQMTVMFIILFSAHQWLDLEDGTKADYDGRPTEHLTLVFNAFVWMTLFNQLNARRIDGSLDIFSGLDTNPMYLGIMGIEILGQAIVIEFGGFAMRTAPQSGRLWGIAIAFGSGSLLWNVFLQLFVKDEWVPQWFINIFKVTLNKGALPEDDAAPVVTVNDGIAVTTESADAKQAGTGAGAVATTASPGSLKVPVTTRPRSDSTGSRGRATTVEGLRPRTDSLSSMDSAHSAIERVGKFLAASRRVQSGLRAVRAFQHVGDERQRRLNLDMVDKANALRARSGIKAATVQPSDLHERPARELSGVGAQALWAATLDTIRKQVLPVAAFKEALSNASDRDGSAPGPSTNDADLELGVGLRTESYRGAMSGDKQE